MRGTLTECSDAIRAIKVPELPEVEVTRRALAPYVERQTVESVTVRDSRLRWPVPPRLSALLAGRTVERLRRRGKYLLWEFVHGTLISHLGMSAHGGVAAAPRRPCAAHTIMWTCCSPRLACG